MTVEGLNLTLSLQSLNTIIMIIKSTYGTSVYNIYIYQRSTVTTTTKRLLLLPFLNYFKIKLFITKFTKQYFTIGNWSLNDGRVLVQERGFLLTKKIDIPSVIYNGITYLGCATINIIVHVIQNLYILHGSINFVKITNETDFVCFKRVQSFYKPHRRFVHFIFIYVQIQTATEICLTYKT